MNTQLLLLSLASTTTLLLPIDYCTAAAIEKKTTDENDSLPPPPCSSKIYCEGELLHDSALLGFSYHQKKMRSSEQVILKRYKELKKQEKGQVPYATMEQFLRDNFEDGNEFEKWTPPDFEKAPSIVDEINDQLYKDWALDLNNIWRILARKVREDVKKNAEQYSFLYVPNGFVIPGGIFKELYYWDSLWILNGLLLCDMHETARGVIENFFYIIKNYGFIPNGSRKYFLNRSQPPMIVKMVENYYIATDDFDFIKDNIQYLDKEFQHWLNRSMVTVNWEGQDYQMARYFVNSRGPRPESYRKDYMTAQVFRTDEEKLKYYMNVKAAAESGMDFSSRWFIKQGTNKGNLSDIATSDIIPVDLNSFLQYNAELLSEWYFKLGNDKKGEEYQNIATELLIAIEDVLWDKDEGIWLDFDMANNMRRNYFYASNFAPLWTLSFNSSWSNEELSKKILAYLEKQKLDKYTGIPNSLEDTGEQWDYPNAWAPMQAIIVEGLDNLNTTEASEKAFELANDWIETNYKGFKEKKVMYEKYDVVQPGTSGSGGEYNPQSGFGWTNGVALEFLARWGDRLEAVDNSKNKVTLHVESEGS